MKSVKKASVFEACIVILLIVLVGLLVLAMYSTSKTGSWEVNGTGKIDYLLAGSDDTLYVFSGDNITAINSDGRLSWTYRVPENWSIVQQVAVSQGQSYIKFDESFTDATSGYSGFLTRIVADSPGHLYVYLYQDLPAAPDRARPKPASDKLNWGSYWPVTRYGKLVCISDDGIDWEYPLDPLDYDLLGPDTCCNPVSITEKGGRIYLFHEDKEDVLNRSGHCLFTLSNISAPAAVDDAGMIYCIRSYRPDIDFTQVNLDTEYSVTKAYEIDGNDLMALAADKNHTIPSGIVQAYYPNGSLAWIRELSHHAVLPSAAENVWSRYNTLPLYCNGTLYVEIRNGIAALNRDGDYMWTCQLTDGNYKPLDYMPIDSDGNVYMTTSGFPGQNSEVRVINRSGYATPGSWVYSTYDYRLEPAYNPLPLASNDGLLYAVEGSGYVSEADFEGILESKRFRSDTITAYNLLNGTKAWNFTPPTEDRHVAILDEHNYLILLRHVENVGPFSNMWPYYYTNETQPLRPTSYNHMQISPGANVTYISYYASVYEDPVVFNRSRCIYAKGLYAISNNGSLIWSMPVDGFVEGITASNESVYYATRDGRIGSGRIPPVAAGITLAAVVYLFLRFFVVGAVARARSRIDQNENRMQVLQHILAHPGSSANEISRAIEMNHGTVRYHLFVLTMNHKVATYQDGDKYLRYFKNSGAYTPEERAFLSLVRRDPVRKMLKILEEKPGLSGLELSRELGVSSTAAHRHIGLLVKNGILDRKPHRDRGYVYTIKDQYKPYVAGLTESGKQSCPV